MQDHAALSISDLSKPLQLVDGLKATADGREIVYSSVRLRSTSVADERWAQRASERVMFVGGKPMLLTSDAEFRFALTCRHIEAFVCDGQALSQVLMGEGLLDYCSKLSPHDLGLIEQRIFLLEMADSVRYGTLTQAEFEAILAGDKPMEGSNSPQPSGSAAGVGEPAAEPVDGPALLADYSGDAAHGASAGLGR